MEGELGEDPKVVSGVPVLLLFSCVTLNKSRSQAWNPVSGRNKDMPVSEAFLRIKKGGVSKSAGQTMPRKSLLLSAWL